MKKLIDKKIKINNYNDLIKGIDKLWKHYSFYYF
jgi:hypothetical protein